MTSATTFPWPGAKSSEILVTLDSEMFVEVSCERVPGEVVWCNYDLARDLGFSVPYENYLDEKLREELLSACSVRVTEPDTSAHQQIKLYADRYGGFGLGHNFGSARGAFLPFGNLFVKGIGHTPLYHDLPGKLINTHGNLHMWHGLYVASLAEVCLSLFGQEPARILCVIDQGGETVFPDGRKHERAIEVRAGNHLRPAHAAITKRRNDCPQAINFISMASKTGQLVFQDIKDGCGDPIPNLKETMLKVISSQAKSAAMHARWRLVHGSLSAANTLLDGGALDIAQARSNPRSVPLAPEYDLEQQVIPRGDYGDRVSGLEETYHSIRRSLEKEQRYMLQATPLDIRKAFDKEYLRKLELELCVATGLKRKLINKMIKDAITEVPEFAQVIISLTALKNPKSWCKVTTYDHKAAVVDVYSLLGELPQVYFEETPSYILSFIRDRLNPHFLGDTEQIALLKKQFLELSIRLQKCYANLMTKAELYIDLFWSNKSEFKNSVAARARFENKPIDEFFFDHRFKTFQAAATHFRESKNQLQVQNIMQRTITNSCRNIDAILFSGGQKPLENEGIELQIRRIEGVTYSLCVCQQQSLSTTIRIDLCLPKTEGSQYQCEYTLGDVCNSATIAGKRISSTKIRFEISIPYQHQYGVLSGHILIESEKSRWVRTGKELHYVYASPDHKELQDLKDKLRKTCD